MNETIGCRGGPVEKAAQADVMESSIPRLLSIDVYQLGATVRRHKNSYVDIP